MPSEWEAPHVTMQARPAEKGQFCSFARRQAAALACLLSSTQRSCWTDPAVSEVLPSHHTPSSRLHIRVTPWAGSSRRVPSVQAKFSVRVPNTYGLFSGGFGDWLGGGVGGKTETFSSEQAALMTWVGKGFPFREAWLCLARAPRCAAPCLMQVASVPPALASHRCDRDDCQPTRAGKSCSPRLLLRPCLSGCAWHAMAPCGCNPRW